MGYVKHADRPKIKKMHKEGFHVETIASCLCYSPVMVANLLEGAGKIPKWRGEAWAPGGEASKVDLMAESDSDDPAVQYLPSSAQIQQACKRLKSKWSAGERCRRSGGLDVPPDPYTVPQHLAGPFRHGDEKEGV